MTNAGRFPSSSSLARRWGNSGQPHGQHLEVQQEKGPLPDQVKWSQEKKGGSEMDS